MSRERGNGWVGAEGRKKERENGTTEVGRDGQVIRQARRETNRTASTLNITNDGWSERGMTSISDDKAREDMFMLQISASNAHADCIIIGID